jgi:hypothetical protein
MKRTRFCPLCQQDIGEHRFDMNLLTGKYILLCPKAKRRKAATKPGGK